MEFEQKYSVGSPYMVNTGSKDTNQSCLCLYGDVNNPIAPYIMDSATAEIPDQAQLSDHQKISMWFRYAKYMAYSKISENFRDVAELLARAGWKMAPVIGNYPDTGSSIGDLRNSDDFEFFSDKTLQNIPIHKIGYNLAKEFVIVAEKVGTTPIFSEIEINKLKSLFSEAMKIAFENKKVK